MLRTQIEMAPLDVLHAGSDHSVIYTIQMSRALRLSITHDQLHMTRTCGPIASERSAVDGLGEPSRLKLKRRLGTAWACLLGKTRLVRRRRTSRRQRHFAPPLVLGRCILVYTYGAFLGMIFCTILTFTGMYFSAQVRLGH